MNLDAPPLPLAAAQQALLATLFARASSDQARSTPSDLEAWIDRSHTQSARGLLAYRANGLALAARALRAAYPVVCAVLGDGSFDMLARTLWHQHPPQRGDIARWGDTLPVFVQDDQQLASLPWLADVARAEWALHLAATAEDAWADPASFTLLQDDPVGLTLRRAPGLQLVHSRWPVASIVSAHREASPSLDEAWRRCCEPIGEITLVWRAGLRPRLMAIEPADAALLQRLIDGADLPHALDSACEVAKRAGTSFDLGAWLAHAVQLGTVLGVARLRRPSPTTGESR